MRRPTTYVTTDEATVADEMRTPTRPRKSAKIHADARHRGTTTVIADEDRNLPITPGEEDRSRLRDGESRRVSVASTVAATPESAMNRGWSSRFGGDGFEATPWTPVGTRRGVPASGGGFDSPERERAGGAGGEEATVGATVGAEEDAYVYGTPPSSPRAADVAKLVCPRTPMKARRTRERVGLDENGDVRPRGRVVRSLLEEFDAAERSLEDMVENKSESTTLWKNRLDENFDPFDEPA